MSLDSTTPDQSSETNENDANPRGPDETLKQTSASVRESGYFSFFL